MQTTHNMLMATDILQCDGNPNPTSQKGLRECNDLFPDQP